jgi:hypothetical protein
MSEMGSKAEMGQTDWHVGSSLKSGHRQPKSIMTKHCQRDSSPYLLRRLEIWEV